MITWILWELKEQIAFIDKNLVTAVVFIFALELLND